MKLELKLQPNGAKYMYHDASKKKEYQILHVPKGIQLIWLDNFGI